MLIVPKRNYPPVFSRSNFANRGNDFTSFACQMRCVCDDLFTQTITLHYLSDNSVTLRLLYQKREFLIPIIMILKALKQCTDRQIYDRLKKGNFNQNQISDRIEAILLHGKQVNIYDSIQARAMIGSRLRVILTGVHDEMTDVEAGEIFLSNHIWVHTKNYEAKFDTLWLMIDKLYAGVAN